MENKDTKKTTARKDSEQFIKVYMICLIVAVSGLISISYLSQEKLNNEIDRLTELVDTTQDEAETSLGKVESLQKLTVEQEKTINLLEEELSQLEKYQNRSQVLALLVSAKEKYYEKKYAEARIVLNNIEELDLEDYLPTSMKSDFSEFKTKVIEAEVLVKMGYEEDLSEIVTPVE